MIPIIDYSKCTGCGQCVDVCPTDAIKIADIGQPREEIAAGPDPFIILSKNVAVVQDDMCEECGFCSAECPVKAIRIPFPVYEE